MEDTARFAAASKAIAHGLYGSWKPTAAERARLEQIFPMGVCDYSKPGVDQAGAIPWLTYQDRRGHVIYGGRPLGDPPRSHRVRSHQHRS